MKPPYKDKQNRWYTESLFYERVYTRDKAHQADFIAPFTLYTDRPGFISARKTFVDLGDPTGYAWAIKYLGDWEHMQKLLTRVWFRDAYDVWVAELEMKTKSDGIRRLREIMNTETPQAGVAAKYLASLEYKKATRGRPSKDEINGEMKRLIRVTSEEDDDAERVGLKLVTRG